MEPVTIGLVFGVPAVIAGLDWYVDKIARDKNPDNDKWIPILTNVRAVISFFKTRK